MYVETPPDYREIMAALDSDEFMRLIDFDVPDGGEQYLHWDKLRHLTPPQGLDHKQWWFVLKMGRSPQNRPLPLEDAQGRSFTYAIPDLVLEGIHKVDQRCSGQIAMPDVVTSDSQAQQHYLVNSLMEEAIRSSQLEGATTSRRAGKDLLRTGRSPRDRSERMILNNYRALQFMREQMGEDLTPELVLELHRIVTDETLDNPDSAGRLQRPDEDRVAVYDRDDLTVLHEPPPAEQLGSRLEAMCEFANGASPHSFVHPVLRAILLHFWLAYDHPFEDGNGRTARTLFYWCMRRNGYWLTEYLTISTILRRAPGKYSRAFLLTETDARDTTYFILYQLEVILRAVADMTGYLQRKVAEVRDVESLLRGSTDFNHRQLSLLGAAVRDPGNGYTLLSHAASHGVTHETARKDLGQLVDLGLLERRRDGKRFTFLPSAEIVEKLRRLD